MQEISSFCQPNFWLDFNHLPKTSTPNQHQQEQQFTQYFPSSYHPFLSQYNRIRSLLCNTEIEITDENGLENLFQQCTSLICKLPKENLTHQNNNNIPTKSTVTCPGSIDNNLNPVLKLHEYILFDILTIQTKHNNSKKQTNSSDNRSETREMNQRTEMSDESPDFTDNNAVKGSDFTDDNNFDFFLPLKFQKFINFCVKLFFSYWRIHRNQSKLIWPQITGLGTLFHRELNSRCYGGDSLKEQRISNKSKKGLKTEESNPQNIITPTTSNPQSITPTTILDIIYYLLTTPLFISPQLKYSVFNIIYPSPTSPTDNHSNIHQKYSNRTQNHSTSWSHNHNLNHSTIPQIQTTTIKAPIPIPIQTPSWAQWYSTRLNLHQIDPLTALYNQLTHRLLAIPLSNEENGQIQILPKISQKILNQIIEECEFSLSFFTIIFPKKILFPHSSSPNHMSPTVSTISSVLSSLNDMSPTVSTISSVLSSLNDMSPTVSTISSVLSSLNDMSPTVSTISSVSTGLNGSCEVNTGTAIDKYHHSQSFQSCPSTSDQFRSCQSISHQLYHIAITIITLLLHYNPTDTLSEERVRPKTVTPVRPNVISTPIVSTLIPTTSPTTNNTTLSPTPSSAVTLTTSNTAITSTTSTTSIPTTKAVTSIYTTETRAVTTIHTTETGTVTTTDAITKLVYYFKGIHYFYTLAKYGSLNPSQTHQTHSIQQIQPTSAESTVVEKAMQPTSEEAPVVAQPPSALVAPVVAQPGAAVPGATVPGAAAGIIIPIDYFLDYIFSPKIQYPFFLD